MLDYLPLNFSIWVADKLILENVKWVLTQSLDRLFNKKILKCPKQASTIFLIYLCEVGLSVLMIDQSKYHSTLKSTEDALLVTVSNSQSAKI